MSSTEPNNVVELDDYRPHMACFDSVENTFHVMSFDHLRKMADGRVPVTMDESMIRALCLAAVEAYEDDLL